MPITQLRIEGMTCGGCARAVENALQTVPGVLSARADQPNGTAKVESAATVNPNELVHAVEKAGFSAEVAG